VATIIEIGNPSLEITPIKTKSSVDFVYSSGIMKMRPKKYQNDE